MNQKHHTRETVRGIVFVLVLAGSVLAFNGSARASETEGSTAPAVSATQEAPNTGWYQQRRAAREARRKASLEQILSQRQNAAQNQGVPAAVALPAALTRIYVSFKQDCRLTRNDMGDLWVSPPTYSGVQEGHFTVEARGQGLDAKGNPVDLSPEWIPADPEMVTVSPRLGKEVKITVQRAGQSKLKVTLRGFATELSIKAMKQGHALQVEISQNP